MFDIDKEYKLDEMVNSKDKEYLSKTKKEFNKLVEEASRLKNNMNIDNNEIIKNENYIRLLESNIDFIENEYKDNVDYNDYGRAINILEGNIMTLQNRINSLKGSF